MYDGLPALDLQQFQSSAAATKFASRCKSGLRSLFHEIECFGQTAEDIQPYDQQTHIRNSRGSTKTRSQNTFGA